MKLTIKFLISLALIAMMASTVYAAPPTQLWSDAVGTNDIALSKDGNYVAVATITQVRFYSRSSGTPIWAFDVTTVDPSARAYSVAISANGDCVVLGGQSSGGGGIAFWKNARSLTGNPSPTWNSVNLNGGIFRGCLDISDDGDSVAACGTGRWVFYWAGAKGRSTNNEAVSWRSAFYWNVEEVDLSSNGDYVAAGVRIDASTYGAAYWKNAKTLTGNPQNPDWLSTEPAGRVTGIAVSDDGNYVAAASYSGSVHYWTNAKTLSIDPPSTWRSPTGTDFNDLDMSGDGNSVIAGAIGTTKGVYFWAGATGLTGKPQNPNWTFVTTGDVVRVVIDNAGDYMAAFNDLSGPPRVYFYDKMGILKWSYDPDNTGYGLSISGDGGTLAVGTAPVTTAYLFDTGYRTSGPPVGGVVVPTNKTEILAPYLALAGLVAVMSAVVVVKRRRD